MWFYALRKFRDKYKSPLRAVNVIVEEQSNGKLIIYLSYPLLLWPPKGYS